ncbi:NAD(P)-dependent oxidoreductase [Actinomadura spongiicola]|uniref:NAD(P)-dependent oxidoreductase n=2 Tax=Actinomadura spongiicola TaxID=2303421 RepID=A0A372GPY2_9ACTN|nr:NAD(P)-dependent oxidoreductase [Actinomadura spongiicola]
MARKHDGSPVTVLGLGLMGQALAGAFLRKGHATTVWNRTASKAERLVAQGAKLAGSVRDAAAASPLVVICVSDHEVVGGLLEQLDDVLDGKVVVNLSSGTSAQARDLAARAARRGGALLDGAIMAVPDEVGSKDVAVVYSGSRAAFDAYEPVLRDLAEATYLGEDHGLSSLYEVAVMPLMWGILNGFLHGAAMLGAVNVNASAFAPIAEQAIGSATRWLAGYARQIDEGVFPPVDVSIDLHRAEMQHVVAESEALGVNAELPKFIRAMADRAVAAGHGGESYPAMIELFRAPG